MVRRCAVVLLVVLMIYLAFYFTPIEENDFEDAVNFVLKWEGGYVNDPNDPGGLTKYGICQRSYPKLDIENLTIDDAKKIYYENYWLKLECDQLSPPFDIIIFDTSVNCGASRAKEFLDKCSGWEDYLLIRIQFYSQLETSKYFIRGWVNRVVNLYEKIGGDGK